MENTSEKLIRVEKWLKGSFPGLSQRHRREALEQGWIRQSGRRLRKGDKILPTGQLDCASLVQHLSNLKKGNPEIELPVVYEDDSIWVIDKPAGIPSHPISLLDTNTVTHWAFARDAQLYAEFSESQPTVAVHRLDTNTTGLLIVAKTSRAYAYWRDLFHRHDVEKTYHALTTDEGGDRDCDEFTIESWIGHDPDDSTRMKAALDPAELQGPSYQCTTHAKILKRENGRALIEVTCRSGITHQVRVHLAFAGFPLIGDKKYDAHWDTREDQSTTHKLRAVKLTARGMTFEVPAQPL